MPSDCIFCKIVAGEIPCSLIMEDEAGMAFLDINPVRPGHALLVPKKHYERLTDMPGEEAGALLAALPRLATAVVKGTGADGFNVFQTNGACAGQVVPHVHFHVIPRKNNDGAGFRWKAGAYGGGEMDDVLARIKAGME